MNMTFIVIFAFSLLVKLINLTNLTNLTKILGFNQIS